MSSLNCLLMLRNAKGKWANRIGFYNYKRAQGTNYQDELILLQAFQAVIRISLVFTNLFLVKS